MVTRSDRNGWIEQNAGKVLSTLLIAIITAGGAFCFRINSQLELIREKQSAHGADLRTVEDKIGNLWTRPDQQLFVEALRRELDARSKAFETRFELIEAKASRE